MTNFVLAHLGAALVLAEVLKRTGKVVFSDTDPKALVNTNNYDSTLVEHIVLLDVLSRALVARIYEKATYQNLISNIKSAYNNKVNNTNGQ